MGDAATRLGGRRLVAVSASGVRTGGFVAVRCGGQDVSVRADPGYDTRSMLWPVGYERSLKAPEQGLLDAIAAGELDVHLVALADAIHARQQLLHTVRSATAIAELNVGDTVIFNRRVRPRYLEHELGVIESLDDHWVTVRLWRPVGRFGSGPVRCPPLALQQADRDSTSALR